MSEQMSIALGLLSQAIEVRDELLDELQKLGVAVCGTRGGMVQPDVRSVYVSIQAVRAECKRLADQIREVKARQSKSYDDGLIAAMIYEVAQCTNYLSDAKGTES